MSNTRMISRGFLTACAVAAFGFSAFALDLDGARASGAVVERADGYIASASPNASSDVAALVASVNAARKSEYQKVAAKNGQSLEVVEKLAAAKIQEKLRGGN